MKGRCLLDLVSKWLGIISGLMFVVAYLDYNRDVLRRKITPNGATWAIWAVIALISAGTYITSVGDFWKSIISFLNTLLCIGTFGLALLGGRFTRLDKTEWVALLIGLCAVATWVIWRSAAHANLIVQLAIAIGFVTTWRGVWQWRVKERPRPWWTWTGCYALLTIVVIMRWKGHWIDLAYPINCTLLHALVAIFQLKQDREVDRLWKEHPKLTSMVSQLGLLPPITADLSEHEEPTPIDDGEYLET